MASTRTPKEVWMRLHNRRLLVKLMLLKEASQREVAEAAGWSSHSYLGRLMRGEVDTLDIEPAVRIAHYLEVGVDDLFVPRSSSATAQHVQRRETQGRNRTKIPA